MAAGLGFKDFVTGEVLTANDVDGYLMQGTWVFASAAARSAAVTSPQEGNMSYLKDTNSTEYYSGSAWVAVGAAGGGITLLSTTSLSGSSTTVSSIDQTYTNLYVVMSDFYTSGGAQWTIKPNGTNNIGRNVLGAGANLSTLVDNANILSPGIGTATSFVDSVAYLDVVNYANTSITKPVNWYGNATGGSTGAWMASGSFQTSSAISSLVFAPASGTWSGGSVRIYGVK